MEKQYKIALAGNPNSGKTTIFNAMTGSRQHVGNYPGVTVEKKEGVCKHKGTEIEVVDLPGTYSLTAYSVEEIVARNFIIDERPDVVIDVIDASNTERNLFLATQLMEMDVPVVLAFNMSDIAKQRGMVFDIDHLSDLLGMPIVETVGSKNEGVDKLIDKAIEVAVSPDKRNVQVHFGHEIEEEIQKVSRSLEFELQLVQKYGRRWLALKLLERDDDIFEKITSEQVKETVNASISHLETIFGDSPEIIIADRRYGFISGACQESIKNTVESRHDFSDQIDSVVTHSLLGLPIFIVLMYIVFQLTFSLGQFPVGWLENMFQWLAGVVSGFWPAGAESDLKSLLVDGIIGGVGGVIVFLPNIMLLFLAIAFLEDSGYMSRAAFIMDRIMHKIGLHGKSFIPMLIGFGCSVPAIMSTRILENRRNRLTTIMVIPLMSCGARFPIYALIIPAFFADKWQGPVMWLIYFIGIAIAIVCAKLLRGTVFRGESVPFVMELPPYRMPTVKGLIIHMWDRGWLYLKKAGTVILGITIILWAASTYPKTDTQVAADTEAQQTYALENSFVGRAGKVIEPVIKPLGFDYRIGTALIGAMAAKEVFVSQLGIVYSLGEVDESSEALQERLRADYTPLTGFCIMLFCLVSAPCIATVAITRRETGSWGWAIAQFTGLTVLAYLLTLIVYQVGSRIA